MILEKPDMVLKEGEKVIHYFSNKYNQRIVSLNGQTIWWNCTCRWASIGRWKNNCENKKCKHIKKCEEIIKKNSTTQEI